MATDPKNISPDEVLKQVVDAIPDEIHSRVIIVGSLAAAYWYSDKNPSFSVRTKDVDTVLSPRAEAKGASEAVAHTLLKAGWKPREGGKFGTPGTESTPDEDLPALRLHPPGNDDWFLELLTEPESEAQHSRRFMRFTLSTGEHYGLPSFQFTSIATYGAKETKFGIRAAKPEMMALANLLEHPEIKPQFIEGTSTKRSNKDLGRVLALAWLSDDAEAWAPGWLEALQERFPSTWRELAGRAGSGLQALLDSPADFEQAVQTCNNGLLANRNVTSEALMATGNRLLAFAIEELRKRSRE